MLDAVRSHEIRSTSSKEQWVLLRTRNSVYNGSGFSESSREWERKVEGFRPHTAIDGS